MAATVSHGASPGSTHKCWSLAVGKRGAPGYAAPSSLSFSPLPDFVTLGVFTRFTSTMMAAGSGSPWKPSLDTGR